MTWWWGGLGFDRYRPAWVEADPEARRKQKAEYIHQFPGARPRRWVWKMCDFRPETCERCRRLEWIAFNCRIRWFLEQRFPSPGVLAWWQTQRRDGGDIDDLYQHHLVHECHVLALLPPPSSEADSSSAIPSATNITTLKTEPDYNSGRRYQEIAVSQTGAALFVRGPVPASAEKEVEVKKLPMMPIRDVVIFPYMMTPFVLGRESSVRALEEALAADKKIFLATQHDAGVDELRPNEIYQVGTVVNIVQSLKLPDGNIKVLVEGIERGHILQVTETEGLMQVTVSLPGYASESTPEIETAKQQVKSLFEQYVKLRGWEPINWIPVVLREEDPDKITDTIAGQLQFSIEEKQGLLEIFDPAERLNRIGVLLALEIEKLN